MDKEETMKQMRRTAALVCIGLLTLSLTVPAVAVQRDDTVARPSIVQMIWDWLFSPFTVASSETEPDGGGLQVPPGSP
jgi:hypothetical protein